MNNSIRNIIILVTTFLIAFSCVSPLALNENQLNPKNSEKENLETADLFPGPPTGSVTIINPNNSSYWIPGNTYEITWQWTGSFGQVLIALETESGFCQIDTVITANDGSYFLYIPCELIIGSNDYRIYITAFIGNYVNYISDYSEYFTVETYFPQILDSISITSPTSSSSWLVKTTQKITWTHTEGFLTFIVAQFDLYKGGVFYQTIGFADPRVGEYLWNIPLTILNGNNYQIKAFNPSNPLVYDYSDYFSIINIPFPIFFLYPTLPNENCIWEGGKSYEIQWTSMGCSNSIDITLWKGGAYIEDIVITTSNDGIYTWSVPIDLIEGNDYVVKCIDHNNPSIQGNSEYFSIISPPGTSVIPTPTGTNVEIIEPDSGLSIIFDNVQESGTTVIVNSTLEPEPPSGFEVVGDYYEISTDATFSGLITVAIPYDETKVKGNEKHLKLYHWEADSGWTDITTYVDILNNIVYGEVSSFSTFLIIYPKDTTPPIITIDYIEGDFTDGNPGQWNAFAYDSESGINNETIKVFIDEVLVGTTLGNYDVPNELGTHLISVEVENNDEINHLIAINNASVNIIDDDTTPPEISNLLINNNIHNITVSFDASDNSGIYNIVILIDGALIEPIQSVNNGTSYIFIFENNWILKNKFYEVKISVIDADNDRLDDQLTSLIIGSFEITLKDIYDYVNWQIEELKEYINQNLCSILSWIMAHKLSLSQKQLIKAYNLIEQGLITCGLFHDAIAQVLVELSEFKTELFNRLGFIDNDNALVIVTSLHNIRNDIVILIGASVGLEQAYDIALVELDLLNLKDLIENELADCQGICLEIFMDLSAANLEMAIFKLALQKDINPSLTLAQNLLDLAIKNINHLLNKGKISQELANMLINKINIVDEKIENL